MQFLKNHEKSPFGSSGSCVASPGSQGSGQARWDLSHSHGGGASETERSDLTLAKRSGCAAHNGGS